MTYLVSPPHRSFYIGALLSTLFSLYHFIYPFVVNLPLILRVSRSDSLLKWCSLKWKPHTILFLSFFTFFTLVPSRKHFADNFFLRLASVRGQYTYCTLTNRRVNFLLRWVLFWLKNLHCSLNLLHVSSISVLRHFACGSFEISLAPRHVFLYSSWLL